MLYLCELNTDVLCHCTGLYSCLCAGAVFVLFCVLCNMAGTWVRLILLVSSFSTGMLWCFWVFCVTKWVLGSSFLFMWIMPLKLLWGLHWTWNHYNNINSANTWTWEAFFFFLVPSTISFFSILLFLFQTYLASFKLGTCMFLLCCKGWYVQICFQWFHC